MLLNFKEILEVLVILMMYAAIILGIKKFHIIPEVKRISKKEWKVSLTFIFVSFIFMFFVVSHLSKYPDNNGVLEKILNNNSTAAMIFYNTLFCIPAGVINAITIKRIYNKLSFNTLPLYHLIIICLGNPELYAESGKNLYHASTVLICSTILFAFVDCLQEVFTKKKILYIIFFAVVLSGICWISNVFPYSSLYIVAQTFVFGIIAGFILKYARYLRVTLRRLVTILTLLLVLFTYFNL